MEKENRLPRELGAVTDLSSFGPERFSSRELSRLEFGARLLDLGEDHRLPILERCKFVAIFSDMIDEFFQVRVVSLQDKVAAGVQTPSVDGIRPRQQLEAIRERVLEPRRAPRPIDAGLDSARPGQ